MTDVTQYDSIIKTALRKKRVRKDQREDISQECYVALLERGSELDPELAGKICQTRIKTLLQEQRRSKLRFVSADPGSLSHLLSKIIAEQNDQISESELYEAVDSLDESFRDVIKSVYIDGLTERVAAEKLGIPLRTLQRKKSRGIMVLRSKLEVNG